VAIYFPTFTFDAFPMLFMGAVAALGTALTLLLPETLGAPLVESVKDQKLMYENDKKFFSWWSSEKLKEVQEAQAAKRRTQAKVDGVGGAEKRV